MGKSEFYVSETIVDTHTHTHTHTHTAHTKNPGDINAVDKVCLKLRGSKSDLRKLITFLLLLLAFNLELLYLTAEFILGLIHPCQKEFNKLDNGFII